MRFLFPSLFYAWTTLAIAVVLLYLFRPRPRTVKTSTLPFFKWLAKEHQDSAWLKRLKYLASLLLGLLLVLAAAAALGRLVISPPEDAVKTVVLLVDRSASMAAAEVATPGNSRPNRLAQAVALAKQRLAGLPVGVGVVVMAYDRRPEVLLSRSVDRREVLRSLDAIQPRPLEGRPESALPLARQLAALEPPGIVWHVTDGETTELEPEEDKPEEPAAESAPADAPAPIPSEPDASESVRVEPIIGGHRLTNVGLTAFQLRRSPLEKARFEAFAQVAGWAPESLPVEVEVHLDEKLIAIRKLTLAPGGRETLLVPIEAGHDVPHVLSLRVVAEGDCLPLDDVVLARVPKLRSIRVLWITESPDPFTELALSSLGADSDVQVLQGGPSAWPPKGEFAPDVTLFDGWLPGEWPTQTPAIVLNPGRSVGPLKAVKIDGGLPLDSVRAPLDSHPVLYGVANDRVAVTQTATLAADGTLQPLWLGSHGPVLLAGESGGQRVIVMGFSPQQSEQLPLMASYPLLIGNAIYWSAEKSFASTTGLNHRTGDLVRLAGRRITWRGSPGERETIVELPGAPGRHFELDRLGLWETDAEKDSGEKDASKTDAGELGSAALLSVAETVLPGDDEAAAAPAMPAGPWLRGDLLPGLLWLLLLILVGESWLYHRYLVY